MRACATFSQCRGQNMRKNKLGQEEMVGFALIVVIVSIILLIFLSFYLRSSSNVEIQSYEADGFVQSVLQYTSDCEQYDEFLSVQNLIFDCDNKEKCSDDRDACDVLNKTLEEICYISWNVGEDTYIKGYEMRIDAEGESIFLLNVGNVTQNYKSGFQDFARRRRDYKISFTAYY